MAKNRAKNIKAREKEINLLEKLKKVWIEEDMATFGYVPHNSIRDEWINQVNCRIDVLKEDIKINKELIEKEEN